VNDRDRDWGVIDQLLGEGWGQPWDQRKSDAYRLVLGDYEVADVAMAIRRIIERGGAYRPSIPEVVAAMNTDAGMPTAEEAVALLIRAQYRSGVLEGCHEVVRAFSATVNVGMLPLNDPDWGHVERRRLGEQYEQFVERYKERQREGRALEALGRASRDELKRLDPLAALARPRLLELEGGDSEEAAS
jgi:hypothetical protein